MFTDNSTFNLYWNCHLSKKEIPTLKHVCNERDPDYQNEKQNLFEKYAHVGFVKSARFGACNVQMPRHFNMHPKYRRWKIHLRKASFTFPLWDVEFRSSLHISLQDCIKLARNVGIIRPDVQAEGTWEWRAPQLVQMISSEGQPIARFTYNYNTVISLVSKSLGLHDYINMDRY